MASARLATPLTPGLTLANPILSASGTFGAGLEGSRFSDVSKLGALVTKTVTPRPRAGNPPPRIVETPCGMLNSIGLENPGVEAFLRDSLPLALELGPPIILNIGGESFDEFVAITERVQGCGAAALEVNLSCPNVQGGALPFSTDAQACHDVVSAIAVRSDLPVFVKLSPNVTRIEDIAVAAEAAGADGLTLINTLLGMTVDWRRRRPHLGMGAGGLSGPAIRPVALYMVHRVATRVSIPILGVGGIATADDVCQFLVAGARAVQIGTTNFVDPTAITRMVDEIDELLASEGVDVADVWNTLERPDTA